MGVPTFSFYAFLYLPIRVFHPDPRPSTILAKSGYSTNFQVKEGIKEGMDILPVSGSIYTRLVLKSYVATGYSDSHFLCA